VGCAVLAAGLEDEEQEEEQEEVDGDEKRFGSARQEKSRGPCFPAGKSMSLRGLITDQITPPCTRVGDMWSGISMNQNRSHVSSNSRKFSDV
jgi:hypothetical protein